jgi:hypothetical protein
VARRQCAPGSGKGQRGQRSRGELTVGELAPTPDQPNGQVTNRWLVSDQHHRVDIVGHATQALEQLGAKSAVDEEFAKLKAELGPGDARSEIATARQAPIVEREPTAEPSDER